jgi:hypothetical protein
MELLQRLNTKINQTVTNSSPTYTTNCKCESKATSIIEKNVTAATPQVL